ncbi:MAG: imidazoleglycerol-phosphate dehydratase [Methanothrix sp.]|uniref:imidazoleglycerol-phosphate dehydratase n=1 Tax=Methanothrix sp. TaxID=90426 RepID=UPI0025EFEC4C|nr:imidazoleglycerol-phosphate dehydratase [Methanothrix sp.]MCQ8903640.1 imidazoleglycerol-phosphate dehydratase [Methanothrix sp.]
MTLSARRITYETDVDVRIDLHGKGEAEVSTGVELLDDLLRILAASGRFDIGIKARGDATGDHHLVEDVGITLGRSLSAVKSGTGSAIVPYGDCTALAAVSFGSPGLKVIMKLSSKNIGGMALENLEHFMRSMAYNGSFTLHVITDGGDDMEKIVSAMMAIGAALRNAIKDGGFDEINP